MTNQPDPKPEQFRIEELPQGEETLSPEEAENAEGGIIIVGGLTRTRLQNQNVFTLGEQVIRSRDR
jgi:hypothetical protein